MEKGDRPAIVTVLLVDLGAAHCCTWASWRPQLLPEQEVGRGLLGRAGLVQQSGVQKKWAETSRSWEGAVSDLVGSRVWPCAVRTIHGGPPLGEGALATVPMCPALCSLNFTASQGDRAPLHTTFEA